MRRIAVTNQKGGVGKTTTTVNLGAALARLGQRVLVCDFDPQCNLTVHLDVDPAAAGSTLYDLLHGKATLAEVARATATERLWVAPAGVDLAGVEVELANEVGRETILAQALADDEAARGAAYDVLLVDCPPSLGLLSLNALVACEEVLVPIQAEFFALQGLGKLMEVVELVQRRLNPRLRISSLVSCRYDPSTNLSRAVIADVRGYFGNVLAETVIRRNVKLAEAPSHGKTIFEYAPDSRGAEDYLDLARELLGAAAQRPGREPAPEREREAEAEPDRMPERELEREAQAESDQMPEREPEAEPAQLEREPDHEEREEEPEPGAKRLHEPERKPERTPRARRRAARDAGAPGEAAEGGPTAGAGEAAAPGAAAPSRAQAG